MSHTLLCLKSLACMKTEPVDSHEIGSVEQAGLGKMVSSEIV